MPQTYEESGVRIDQGDRFVRRIKQPIQSTHTKGVVGRFGGFGSLFEARFSKYQSPLLVSSVDGVGTKLKVAQMMGVHDTVGQDLVNHCVNDILTVGAKPLFFLDYFATGRLDLDIAAKVVDGFVKACKENRCALIGGETAEMPGFYGTDEYDLSGTIVGVVEKKLAIDGRKIKKGDVLIGLASTGLHTNGYSLARSVLLEQHKLSDHIDDLGQSIGEALLVIHRSYQKVVSSLLKKFPVKGLAHITGGGIEGNTRRILPQRCRLSIDWNAWERPVLFRMIQRLGEVPEDDMRRTFNLGVGMIIVVSRKNVDRMLRFLNKKGERCMVVGEVTKAGKK